MEQMNRQLHEAGVMAPKTLLLLANRQIHNSILSQVMLISHFQVMCSSNFDASGCNSGVQVLAGGITASVPLSHRSLEESIVFLRIIELFMDIYSI